MLFRARVAALPLPQECLPGFWFSLGSSGVLQRVLASCLEHSLRSRRMGRSVDPQATSYSSQTSIFLACARVLRINNPNF